MKQHTESTKRLNVLIIDDDKKLCSALNDLLGETYTCQFAHSAQEGMMGLTGRGFDLLLLDIGLPDMPGGEFLKIVRKRFPALTVIMLTGNSEPQVIIDCMRLGAADYVIKGAEDFETHIQFRMRQTLMLSSLVRENKNLKTKVLGQMEPQDIVGATKASLKLKSEILRLKGTSAFVLISGENGTGKELVARAINLQEDDPSRPFVAVNCSGIPESLFESEFFGHVKGAFTGAIDKKLGKFEAADGGDIFLDEIGEIPLLMQSKLLRVLQEKVITPVGSVESKQVDVRVIAATNKNLLEEVRKGRFREDLFFRLNRISIEVPSLRDRPEDIPVLANFFLKKHLPMGSFSADALALLKKHSWRGNIRELQHTIERACIFAQDAATPIIETEHISLIPYTGQGPSDRIPSQFFPQSIDDLSAEHIKKYLDWAEKIYLQKGLELVSGDNQSLYTKLKFSRAYYFKRKRAIGLNASNEESDIKCL